MWAVSLDFLAKRAVAGAGPTTAGLPKNAKEEMEVDPEWHFGPFLCKAIPYLQAVVVSASVNTLAAIALERYFAIFWPHKVIIRPNYAAGIVSVLWIIPCCIQIPWAYYYSQVLYPTQKYVLPLTICYPQFPDKEFERGFFLGAVFLTCYLVPLCFICIFYCMIGAKVWRRSVSGIRGTKAERNIQRSKIRIIRMLIVVAVFFTISWLPLYSIRVRILYGPPMPWDEQKVTGVLTPIAQWLGSANSCVNPFIYCYFSEQFRKGMLALLRGRPCCLTRRVQETVNTEILPCSRTRATLNNSHA